MATLALNIDARGATAGANVFQSATNKVTGAADGAATAVTKSGSAISRLGNMSGAQRFVFQNTANQLGDIAVQASMGTNIFRVLGMQLPQVAGGFAILGGSMGTVLPVLGVLAAVGFPLIAMFTQLGSGAKSFSDRIDQLADKMDAVSSAIKLVTSSTKDLEREYGDATAAVRAFGSAQAAIAYNEARRQALDLASALGDLTRKFESQGKHSNRASTALQDLRKATNEAAGEIVVTSHETEFLTSKFDALSASLKAPDQGLQNVRDASVDLLAALDEVGIKLEDTESKALLDFTTALTNMGIESARLAELQKLLQPEILQLGIESEGAADRLKLLMDQMERGSKREMLLGQAPMFINPDALDDAANLYKKLQKEEEQAARKAELLANKAKQATDAIAKISPELKRVNDASEMVGQSFETAFMSAVTGTRSVQDAFRMMAVDIISELYRIFVVKQITGFITSAVSGAFAPASAAGTSGSVAPPVAPRGAAGVFGGPVSPSQGIVVGERGPEVFFPPSKGNLVPNSDLGGVNVQQTFNFAANGDESVKQIIAQQAPKIAKMTQQSILESRRRGGQMKAVFG